MRVIAGNTGRGVNKADAVGIDVCVSIMSVPSLWPLTQVKGGRRVSACISPTQLRAALEALAKQLTSYAALAAHVGLVGNTTVAQPADEPPRFGTGLTRTCVWCAPRAAVERRAFLGR